MELKRILGNDNRQAMEEVVRMYGPDALVVSGHKVNGKFELIVAVDIEADPALIDVPDEELAMAPLHPPPMAFTICRTVFTDASRILLATVYDCSFCVRTKLSMDTGAVFGEDGHEMAMTRR